MEFSPVELPYEEPFEHAVHLEIDLFIKIVRVNQSVSRVYMVDRYDTQVEIPQEYRLFDAFIEQYVPLSRGEWLISWMGDYELIRGYCYVLNIRSKRLQTLEIYTHCPVTTFNAATKCAEAMDGDHGELEDNQVPVDMSTIDSPTAT